MRPKKNSPKKAPKRPPIDVNPPEKLIKHRMFHDRLFIWFITTSVGLSLATIVALVIKVRPRDFVVPYQYSTLQGFDALGPWYNVYSFGVFALMVTLGNIVLAAMSFDKSRIGSFYLILGTIFINLFTLIVVLTLVGHVDI
jgi:hypothetical protein